MKIKKILVLKTAYERAVPHGRGATVCHVPNTNTRTVLLDGMEFSGDRHLLAAQESAKASGFNPSKIRLVGSHYSGYFYA